MNWASRTSFVLWLAPLILVGWAWMQHQQSMARWSQIFSPLLWSKLLPGWDPKQRLRKLVIWSSGVLLLIAALARPQWGAREEEVRTTGLDLMVVLDLSRSMDVEDVVPSRIKKARHWIRSLLQAMQGDRVGVVAFAASSYVASPLTNDLNYVQEVIDVLSPGTLGNQGTDIGLGLETALASLERGAEVVESPGSAANLGSRVILLITDGEDHEGEARRVAARYREKGVRVFVLGVGTQRGGPIPVRDEQGQLQGYKRLGQEVVTSRLEPQTLQQLADAAAGRYWTATDSESELSDLLKELGMLDRSQLASRKILIPHERFQIFVLIGLALLLLEWALPLSSRKSVTLGLMGVLCLLGPGCQDIQSYLRNREGIQAFENKDLDTAKKKFEEAKSKDPTQVQPLFNEGVTKLTEGASQEALKAFESSVLEAKKNGDPWVSGFSLYNQGAALEKSGEMGAAIKSFAEAIRMAQISGDEKLEQDSRKRIEALEKPRQQQQQQQQQQQSQSQNQQQQQQQQQQSQSQNQQQQKEQQQPKNYEDPSVSRRRPFRSEKLTPEDSERVMEELSNREKELQARLKKQRGKPNSQNGKDW